MKLLPSVFRIYLPCVSVATRRSFHRYLKKETSEYRWTPSRGGTRREVALRDLAERKGVTMSPESPATVGCHESDTFREAWVLILGEATGSGFPWLKCWKRLHRSCGRGIPMCSLQHLAAYELTGRQSTVFSCFLRTGG